MTSNIDFPNEGTFYMYWKGNMIDNDITITININGEEVKLKNNKENIMFEVV